MDNMWTLLPNQTRPHVLACQEAKFTLKIPNFPVLRDFIFFMSMQKIAEIRNNWKHELPK